MLAFGVPLFFELNNRKKCTSDMKGLLRTKNGNGSQNNNLSTDA